MSKYLDKMRAKQGLLPKQRSLGTGEVTDPLPIVFKDFEVPASEVDPPLGTRGLKPVSEHPSMTPIETLRSSSARPNMEDDLSLSAAQAKSKEVDKCIMYKKSVNKKKPKTAGGQNAKLAVRGRLPDGSAFAVRYEAAEQRWTGTLTIPSKSGPTAYTTTQGSVFYLLEKLDDLYRADLAEKALDEATKAE